MKDSVETKLSLWPLPLYETQDKCSLFSLHSVSIHNFKSNIARYVVNGCWTECKGNYFKGLFRPGDFWHNIRRAIWHTVFHLCLLFFGKKLEKKIFFNLETISFHSRMFIQGVSRYPKHPVYSIIKWIVIVYL